LQDCALLAAIQGPTPECIGGANSSTSSGLGEFVYGVNLDNFAHKFLVKLFYGSSNAKPSSHNVVAAILPSEIWNLYRALSVEIVTLLPVPLIVTLPAARSSRALFTLFLVEAGHLAQV